MRDICFASQLIGDMTGSTLDDPIGDRYSKLGCTISPLEKETDDYKMILKYLEKTFEPIQFRDGERKQISAIHCSWNTINNYVDHLFFFSSFHFVAGDKLSAK